MSGYCDFNPRLFKPFTSMKTKITPAMADDWEMIPTQFVKLGGFSLKSEKLQQQVADIDLRRFLRFCKEQNLTIEGLRLKGNFVVGNDRSVYTEKMFNTWREKFEKRTETIIDKSELTIGHKYLTPCGRSVVYLGYKYLHRIKKLSKEKLDFSKVNKVPYVAEYDWRGNPSVVVPFKGKCTQDLGKVFTEDEVDAIFKKLQQSDKSILLLSDIKVDNIEYALNEVKYTVDTKYKVLLINGKTYMDVRRWGHNIQVDGNGNKYVDCQHYNMCEIENFTMTGNTLQSNSSYNWRTIKYKVDAIYEIVIKGA